MKLNIELYQSDHLLDGLLDMANKLYLTRFYIGVVLHLGGSA